MATPATNSKDRKATHTFSKTRRLLIICYILPGSRLIVKSLSMLTRTYNLASKTRASDDQMFVLRRLYVASHRQNQSPADDRLCLWPRWSPDSHILLAGRSPIPGEHFTNRRLEGHLPIVIAPAGRPRRTAGDRVDGGTIIGNVHPLIFNSVQKSTPDLRHGSMRHIARKCGLPFNQQRKHR